MGCVVKAIPNLELGSQFDELMTAIDQIRSVGFRALKPDLLLSNNPEILYSTAVESRLATYFNLIELNKLLAQWFAISDPNIWGVRDSYISHSIMLGNRSYAPHARWILKERTLQIMCKMVLMGSAGHSYIRFILTSMSQTERKYYHETLSNKRVRKHYPYKPPRRGHNWLRPCEAQIIEIINAMRT